MTILTIQVDNDQDVALLQKVLKELSFVGEVEIQNPQSPVADKPKGSYQQLKKALDKIDSDLTFTNIQDPSKWQSDLRDEWKHPF